jgi:hypothetical protein
MDSIGLLAAWVGIISFLLMSAMAGAAHFVTPRVQKYWAMNSPVRARRRIQRLDEGLEMAERPQTSYVADLVTLYGSMILNLVAAATVVVVSIEILDLGPALLASTLPFSIDAKLLTRFTGFFLLAVSYCFVFRLTLLAARIQNKTFPRKPGYSQRALREIAELRAKFDLTVKQPVGAGLME